MIPKPTFDQQVSINEMQMRGLYLSIACDVEFVLTDLICACLASTNQQKEDIKAALFEKVMMDRKIKMAKEVLQKYNTQHFEVNKPFLKKFEELKGYRNMLAHARITGDPESKDTNILVMEFVQDGQNQQKKEHMNNLKAKLEGFRVAVNGLLLLVALIYTEKDLRANP